MSQYEVWSKEQLIDSNGKPETVCYVIDTAINLAEKLARGTYLKKISRLKPGTVIYSWYDLENIEQVDIVLPKMYAVIERDKQAVVRGWAKDGRYMHAVDCKRCNNSGEDGNKLCSSCGGSSFKPSV